MMMPDTLKRHPTPKETENSRMAVLGSIGLALLVLAILALLA